MTDLDSIIMDMIQRKKYKYKLIYWDNIVYFVHLKDARKLQDSLPYYQQEDSMILRIKNEVKRERR